MFIVCFYKTYVLLFLSSIEKKKHLFFLLDQDFAPYWFLLNPQFCITAVFSCLILVWAYSTTCFSPSLACPRSTAHSSPRCFFYSVLPVRYTLIILFCVPVLVWYTFIPFCCHPSCCWTFEPTGSYFDNLILFCWAGTVLFYTFIPCCCIDMVNYKLVLFVQILFSHRVL